MNRYFSVKTSSIILFAVMIIRTAAPAQAADVPYVSNKAIPGSFQLALKSKPAPIYYSATDYEGVVLALQSLQADVKAVTRPITAVIPGES